VRDELRVVTALFVDLAGSTALAEALPAEDVKLIVAEALSRAIAVVEAYGGTVKDLAGDGMLALFGAPAAHEDDPERAVRAGLEIASTLAEYAEEVRSGWDLSGFGGRIGVATGDVVVGAVGAGGRVEYGAVGDAVNTAARLQALAPLNGVLVAESTRRSVEELFAWAERERLELKGKAEPVTASVATGLAAATGIAALIGSPLSGRDAELAKVAELAEGLARGRGGAVFIVGDPGIGKSRLAAELAHRVRGAELDWLEGRCVSYGEGLAYWPYRDLLRYWLGVTGQQADVRIRVALARRLEELFPSDAALRQPYLGAILGIRPDASAAATLGPLSPESIQFRSFEVVVELVRALAERRPLAVLIDDLHWADPTSLALTERLLALVEESPLLLVFTTRAETDHASWTLKERAEREYRHAFVELDLGPLEPRAERTLLEALLGRLPPPEVMDRILGYAEGNPFFLEELVSDLRERGPAEDGSFEVPETLETAILARLDRLPPGARRAAVAGSVLGRSFPTELLSAVSGLAEEVRPALHELLRRDLVREERRWPDAVYRFKHALIQEAARRTIVVGDRRELNRRAAEWYEEHYAEGLERVAGLLAHHWSEAMDDDRAIRFLRLAGDRARAEWALDEAARHFRDLAERLERLGRGREAAFTLLQLAGTLHVAMRYAEADAAWQRAFALWEPPEEPAAASPETLRVGVGQLPWDADPWRGYYTSNQRLASNLTDHLADRLPEATLPRLARSWSVSADGLEYRVTLRPDACWNDGRPLTAEQVVDGFRRGLRGGTLDVPSFFCVAGAEAYAARLVDEAGLGFDALSEREFRIRLHRPAPYFVDYFWHPLLAGYRDDGILQGPYRLVELTSERVVIERDPGHRRWRGGNCGRVEMVLEEDDLRRFRSGEVDLAVAPRADEPPEGTTVGMTPLLLTQFFLWRSGADRHLRRAVAHATDRRLLDRFPRIAHVAAGGGFMPPAVPGHTPDIALPFDPELARHELRQAGAPSELTVLVSNEQLQDFHEPLFDLWREVTGLAVNVKRAPMSENVHWRLLGADLTWWHWWAGIVDSEYFLRDILHSASPSNHARYSNPELDDLIDRAAATADGALRLELFHQADRLVVQQEAQVLPIRYGGAVTFAGPHVGGTYDFFAPLFDTVRVER
jgi:class 3 adenylate cyclase/ABC-type transport system substrate-binding protein